MRRWCVAKAADFDVMDQFTEVLLCMKEVCNLTESTNTTISRNQMDELTLLFRAVCSLKRSRNVKLAYTPCERHDSDMIIKDRWMCIKKHFSVLKTITVSSKIYKKKHVLVKINIFEVLIYNCLKYCSKLLSHPLLLHDLISVIQTLWYF